MRCHGQSNPDGSWHALIPGFGPWGRFHMKKYFVMPMIVSLARQPKHWAISPQLHRQPVPGLESIWLTVERASLLAALCILAIFVLKDREISVKWKKFRMFSIHTKFMFLWENVSILTVLGHFSCSLSWHGETGTGDPGLWAAVQHRPPLRANVGPRVRRKAP